MTRNLPETLVLFKKHCIKICTAQTAIVLTLAIILLFLAACSNQSWNNPYRASEKPAAIFYSSFSERPKFLDPARSYSSNEWAFISQIYEPPLQYHFLKRPYTLVPLTSSKMPEVTLFDDSGKVLPADSSADQIAYSEYRINIQPNLRYQPHPAFVQKKNGEYRYWPIDQEELSHYYTLNDFKQTATRELVADDYIYQIKRLAYLPNHSPIAGLMGEHIAGFNDFSQAAKKAYKKNKKRWLDLRAIEMSGVRLIDKYTFSIRINKTYPQFIYWLAMNFFAPMPWEAERFYQQEGMKEKNITLHWYPVGTGPFMLTENNPNLRMVLSKNPNFHGEKYPSEGTDADREAGLLVDAGKTMPFIDKAVYSLEKEAIPRWNKFLQGYYDNSGIASDSFDEAVQFGSSGEAQLTESMLEKGIKLNTAVQASLYYTGFNMRDPVLGNQQEDAAGRDTARKLRQAIAIAIDMEEYISIFQNGRGEAAQSPLPPGIFGFRSGEEGLNPFVYEWKDGKAQRRSIEDAKALMVEAGYAKGIDPKTGGPLILYYDTPAAGPGSKSMLQWYTNQLKKLGVQLVVRSTDYNRFQEKMIKGSAQIFSWGWNADYPDPENFFFLLYGPNGKAEFKGENAANFANEKFDQLFDRMKNLPNGEERQQVIDQMVNILREESPWIFGFYPKAFSLYHQWYKNAWPNLMANNTLKYKRIDAEIRAEKQALWNQPILWPVALLVALLLLAVVPAVRDYRARERSRAK